MIRSAAYEDMESVVEIYNQAIDASFQTGFTQRFSLAERAAWFEGHLTHEYPLFVYVTDGAVVGWFSISPYRAGRDAFRYSVEISYFVHQYHQGKGIGPQLVAYGLNACRQLGYKTVVAIILDRNTASMNLMDKFGFEPWAYLPGIADFGGEECSHVYYGLKLND